MTERLSGGVREPTEEEKFTGLNRGEIPSKSFQRLQSWTGAGKCIVVVVVIIIIVHDTKDVVKTANAEADDSKVNTT